MDWKEHTLGEFADALARPGHAPAGGSAAAVTAALAAALCAMTAGMGVKTGHAGMQPLAEEARALQAELLNLAQEDTDAYGAYLQARREEGKPASHADDALILATEVPLMVARHALRIIELLRQALPHCPRAARPDGLTGIALAEAVMRASLLNARANSAALTSDSARSRIHGEIAALEQQSANPRYL